MLPVQLTGVSPWEPADTSIRNVCTSPSESKAITYNLHGVKPMTVAAEDLRPALANISACKQYSVRYGLSITYACKQYSMT